MALERRAHTRPSPAVGEAREGREPGARGGLKEEKGGHPFPPPNTPPPHPTPADATPRRVGGPLRWALKPRARARVEPPQVQILVVVANIQTRTLKAEVEKGSM